MARKTNKTAHVLNLLTSGDSKEEAAKPDIPIIESPKNAGHPLADIIKDSLDKEINSEEAAREAAMEEIIAEESPQESHGTDISSTALTESDSQAADDRSADSEDEAFDASGPEPEAPVQEIPAAPLTHASPSGKHDPTDSSIISELDIAPIPEKAEEDSFRMVNVMELAVDERLMEFVNRFGLCTCKRCVCDVKALALTNLPSKYIVVDMASLAPLISFYKSKYSIYVVTELTKACLAVQDTPHH